MKNTKKIVSLILAICMLASLALSASAANTVDASGGTGTSSVTLSSTADGSIGGDPAATKMSVTVPTVLPIAVGTDGTVSTATDAKIVNAAKELGYIDRPTNATDMTFVGLGILLGGIIGALAIHIGGVPISLSTSGGALITGLVFGWWRSKRPTFGQIPESSLWVLNNVGLNMFIAVVGISAGPSFVQGLKEVGPMLFIIGALATSLPLLLGLILARYVFKFHPALSLGCTAGARTTTAALGAIQEAVGSETPSLGYTVTYAVGNTLLIIWGVIIVLLIN